MSKSYLPPLWIVHVFTGSMDDKNSGRPSHRIISAVFPAKGKNQANRRCNGLFPEVRGKPKLIKMYKGENLFATCRIGSPQTVAPQTNPMPDWAKAWGTIINEYINRMHEEEEDYA